MGHQRRQKRCLLSINLASVSQLYSSNFSNHILLSVPASSCWQDKQYTTKQYCIIMSWGLIFTALLTSSPIHDYKC